MSKQNQTIQKKGKDQQFQVHTITQNSSQSSTKKDREYQIAYYDDSEQQKNQKSQVKSLQQLPDQQQLKQRQFIIKKQYIEQNEDLRIRKQYHESNKNMVIQEKQQLRAADDLNYQNQLTKKKRKRKQIFQNIKIHNNRNIKPKLSKQIADVNQMEKQKAMNNRVSFQKKRQNHSLLKTWNYERINNLSFHKCVVQQIFKAIDKNMKMSMQYFQIYRSFFMGKYEQQQEYSFQNAAEIANENQVLENNRHSQQIYIACSSMFNILAQKQALHKQATTKLMQFIQKKILKQIFQQYFDNVHKQFILYYERIKFMKEQTQKIDQIVCKKLINLQTYFTQCCQNINKESSKDFYRVQLSFLRKCQSEMMIQSNYGRLILQFYQAAINQQKIRKILLEKSLKLYKQAMHDYEQDLRQLSSKKNFKKIIQNNKNQNSQIAIEGDTQQIKQYYSIENMLNPQTLKELKNKINLLKHSQQNGSNGHSNGNGQNTNQRGDDSITFNQIVNFISKCEVQQFTSHHLIIKKFGIQVFKNEKWIPGQIIITVDKYVHIFINALQNSGILIFGSRVFHKPQFTEKINFIDISFPNNNQSEMENNEDLKIIIGSQKGKTNKIASLLKLNKNIQETLRFSQENDLIQFQDYIVQLSK